MKRLICLLLLIGCTVWAGVEIAKDPGYMLLAYHQWTLETPLWLGIILWLGLISGFLILAQLWRNIGALGSKWHTWLARKRLAQAKNLTLRAMLESIEGYFDSARKHFDTSLHNAELPLLNLLGAAYCAEQLHQSEVRDRYLEKALEAMPAAETAIKLLKIKWLIQAEAWPEAVYDLERLLLDDPYQKQALFLAQTLYQRLGIWDKLLKISTTLRKRKLIDSTHFEDLQIKAYGALLHESVDLKNAKALHNQWIATPGHYQNTPSLVLIYATALIQLEQNDTAIDIIKETLKKHWDDALIACYGQVLSSSPETQLKQAEKWLEQHENNPHLLLALGRLCLSCSLWGKARTYLEASVNIHPATETYQTLAELAYQNGELEKALGWYRIRGQKTEDRGQKTA